MERLLNISVQLQQLGTAMQHMLFIFYSEFENAFTSETLGCFVKCPHMSFHCTVLGKSRITHWADE
jgi:hypothetical protein